MWCLCRSLFLRQNTVDSSPEGNLKTTFERKNCIRDLKLVRKFAIMSEFCQWLWNGHVASLWSRSFFLRWITADPSPWGNFTPPAKQECGETLGDLEPVYDLFPTASEFTLPKSAIQTCGVFVEQVVFLTVNYRGPLPLKELHSTGERISVERPWGILSPFTTCFRQRMNSPCHYLWH